MKRPRPDGSDTSGEAECELALTESNQTQTETLVASSRQNKDASMGRRDVSSRADSGGVGPRLLICFHSPAADWTILCFPAMSRKSTGHRSFSAKPCFHSSAIILSI